jgi:hypothetical protein
MSPDGGAPVQERLSSSLLPYNITAWMAWRNNFVLRCVNSAHHNSLQAVLLRPAVKERGRVRRGAHKAGGMGKTKRGGP